MSKLRDGHHIHDMRDNYTRRYPHLGIAYMAAMLRYTKIRYDIIDMNLGYAIEEVLDITRNNGTDLICITIYSAGYKNVYDLIKTIKRDFTGMVVVGGPHITVVHEHILEETDADFAIEGEGEYALVELVNQASLETIKGLIWRQGSKIITNDKREFIADLDSLPYPAFEDFELDKYLCFTDKRLPIVTSRGCPFQCIYCFGPLMMGRRFRPRSPENIVNEIQYWNDKGWNSFDFNDDVFSFDGNRAKTICELILRRRLKIKFYLAVGLRANSVDEPLLQILKKAGCRFISYGCEAGNEHMLKNIKKGIRIKDVKKAVELTRKIGINHKVNFIIGHPTESMEDALDSIKLAKRLKCNFVGFNNFIPYPGTEAYDVLSREPGVNFLIPPDIYLNDLSHKIMKPVVETSKFTVQEREQALKLGFEIEERALAKFQYGIFKGSIVYRIKQNAKLARIAEAILNAFISTRIGYLVYRTLVKTAW